MKYRWDNLAIVYKLFFTIFGGIAVIIIVLISYLWGHESKLMLQKEEASIHLQSISIANNLKIHISDLQKETKFLSHLEVMNDMVTRDLDGRISTLLEQKANDLGESISLFIVGPDFTISAASKPIQINQIFTEAYAIESAIKKGKSYLFFGQNLYLFTPVYASFDIQNYLGYLVMSYPLKNFTLQLQTDHNVYRWLTPPSAKTIVYKNTFPIVDADSYLQDDMNLGGVLEGWVLHYAMPKNEALALLYHFQLVFLSVFGLGLALIAILIWIVVSQITRPLRELSDTAMTIALTGDFTQSVAETGYDEIGTMAHSFNALVFTTHATIKHLEIERHKHLEKLISLIVFFNAITRADTKEETIEIAMSEIRRFSNAQEVYFTLDQTVTEEIKLALNAVGSEMLGVVCIKNPELKKEANERFYEALERMLGLQMERIELLEKKQAAFQAKSAFLSAMSHELRTPLGSVLSLTQYLMTQSETPEHMCETLGKIENSAYHLLGVINNILDLAKAEAGKVELHIESFDLVALIEDALELVIPLADDKGLQIRTKFESINIVLRSDIHLLRQIIINLLSNAIRYTEYGFIDVRLYYSNELFVLEIKDTGRGIVADALDNLFDEFYQVRSSRQNVSEGSGLGLAISKRFALLLKGDLSIMSEGEGKGTTAIFSFQTF